jgi:hypothetical protein
MWTPFRSKPRHNGRTIIADVASMIRSSTAAVVLALSFYAVMSAYGPSRPSLPPLPRPLPAERALADVEVAGAAIDPVASASEDRTIATSLVSRVELSSPRKPRVTPTARVRRSPVQARPERSREPTSAARRSASSTERSERPRAHAKPSAGRALGRKIGIRPSKASRVATHPAPHSPRGKGHGAKSPRDAGAKHRERSRHGQGQAKGRN